MIRFDRPGRPLPPRRRRSPKRLWSLLAFLAAAGVLAWLLVGACQGSAAKDATPTATPTATTAPATEVPSPTPVPTATPAPTEAPPPPTSPASGVTGFRMPIEGACLPDLDSLMPNAPRTYRFGIHEGIDFYDGHVCVPVGKGTPVRAAKDGVVTVATLDYHDLTMEEWQAIRERSAAAGRTSEEDLFVLRGRQVEIDHGDGTRTRYAHLGAIAPGIVVGARVEAGQVIGYVGNSGTPESISNPDAESHLHFEIRVGESYLGAGLPPDEVRRLYERAFSN